jgi:hypothetical protein
MQAIQTAIGGSQILIETSGSQVDSEVVDEYGTQQTGIRSDLRDAYSQLKDIIVDMAQDMSTTVHARRPDGPSEVSLEFGLSFSGGANMWVLTSSSEVSCKVSMKWTTNSP